MVELHKYKERLYERLYFFEHEEERNIFGRLTFVTTSIILPFGTLVYYFENAPFQRLDFSESATFDCIWFVFLISLGTIFLAVTVAIIFIGYALYSRYQSFLQTPEDIEKASNNFEKEISDAFEKQNATVTAPELLSAYIAGQYMRSATINYYINRNQKGAVYSAISCVYISLIAFGLSIIPYVILHFRYSY